MSIHEPVLEQIIAQIQQFPPDEQLQLLLRLAEKLIATVQPRQLQPLIYGQFRGMSMSTEEDFAVAEWHPGEKELNGA